VQDGFIYRIEPEKGDQRTVSSMQLSFKEAAKPDTGHEVGIEEFRKNLIGI
jgi:hypothetical protein